MATYVDTSAWISLLAREPAAPGMARWLERGSVACTSAWTPVEVASALGIKVRRGDLHEGDAQTLCDAFEELMQIHGVDVLAVHEGDFSLATTLCRQAASALRAGDALHLAVAQRSGCAQFLSFDHNLNRNAALAGLSLLQTHQAQ